MDVLRHPDLIRLQLDIEGRVHETFVPKSVVDLLSPALGAPEPIVDVDIRGKKIRFYVSNLHAMRHAFFLEDIEPDLLDWIDLLPRDSVFYDLGASVGPFSVYAALRGLQVFSFEPEAQNFALLERNHFLNADRIRHPICSFGVALSDVYGLGKIFSADYVAGAHQKILDAPKNVTGEEFKAAHAQSVIKFPLDRLIQEFHLPIPQYLKIDVDGSEHPVIRGAQETLSHPSVKGVFIELTVSDSGRKIIDILGSFGFRCSSHKQVENYEGLVNYVFFRD